MTYILAIDQGTTGTTAALIDAKSLAFVDKLNKEFRQHFPKPGWVEHDLSEIWQTVEKTVSDILVKNKITGKNIVAIGITNQRETTCAFDLQGNPLHKAIVWQDRRTSDFCQQLKGRLGKEISQKTGLPVDPYFSASKMNWLLRNSSEVQNAAKNKTLRFGTIDSFLLCKLSNNQAFKIDSSNASRTLLCNLRTNQWDNELCDLFEVNKDFLPTISDSFGVFGHTKGLSFLPDGIPITGILGDQQSALLGQAGYKPGEMKCTYGTGAFLLLNTGDQLITSQSGLLTTIAYSHQGKATYALEGSTYIAGAAVQWLRDNLQFFPESKEVETCAREINDLSQMEHVLLFPFFTGIGSPHWNSEAKASIVGLTRDTNVKHLSRAALEGIALSINDLVQAFEKDTQNKIRGLKVDGGASANNLLMEYQAAFGSLDIIRPKVLETTAYGAAIAAGLGIKALTFGDIDKLWNEERTFNSQSINPQYANNKKALWDRWMKKLYF